MRYPKWRPLIVRLAEKTFKCYRDALKRNEKTAVEALALAAGVEKEKVQRMIDTHDLLVAALIWLSNVDSSPEAISTGGNCVKSQARLFDEGNPRIFIEDLSILRALCRSKARSMPSDVTARFRHFSVFVPIGYEVDGIAIQPFFVGIDEAEGTWMVTMEIAQGNTLSQKASMSWHVFVRAVCNRSSIRDLPADFEMSRQDSREWSVYIRLAAALCLHTASDKDCLEEGLPPGMNPKDLVWGSRDFRIAKVRTFKFAPKFANKADRASCDVLGHWVFLVHPCYHNQQTGKCRTIWRRGHSRGKDKATPYTLVYGPVPPLQG